MSALKQYFIDEIEQSGICYLFKQLGDDFLQCITFGLHRLSLFVLFDSIIHLKHGKSILNFVAQMGALLTPERTQICGLTSLKN